MAAAGKGPWDRPEDWEGMFDERPRIDTHKVLPPFPYRELGIVAMTIEGKVEGLGDEVIELFADELRRLADLPEDVQIIGTLPTPKNFRRNYEHDLSWYPNRPRERRVAYIHIRHRFCIRCPPHSPMMVSNIDKFLERYRTMKENGA